MKVKICGITDLETALFAVEEGADAIGFVFAESKRKISVEKTREIIAELPKEVIKVGVFVNERMSTVQEVIKETGITTVQFHGDESPEYCTSFEVEVVKALNISSKDDLSLIDDFESEYILLDSPKGKYRGGNGIPFDWNLLSNIHLCKKKIILAGGLHVENVEEAIEQTRPYMVDVSSGVETDGKKDFAKIRLFINRAKTGRK